MGLIKGLWLFRMDVNKKKIEVCVHLIGPAVHMGYSGSGYLALIICHTWLPALLSFKTTH